jgi:hypothetical protein
MNLDTIVLAVAAFAMAAMLADIRQSIRRLETHTIRHTEKIARVEAALKLHQVEE